jgi:predicted secreted protein
MSLRFPRREKCEVRMLSTAGFVVLLNLAHAACAPSTVALTEADAGTTREFPVDTTVEIRLRAQLGTGYSWQLITPDVDGFHSLGASSISPGAVPGGWQEQVFSFTALKPGRYRIAFAYRQPWTSLEQALRRVGFSVVVQASSC